MWLLVLLCHRKAPAAAASNVRRRVAPGARGRTADRRHLEAAGIEAGPLFRGVLKGGRVAGTLDAGDVARIFKAMAGKAALTAKKPRGSAAIQRASALRRMWSATVPNCLRSCRLAGGQRP
jgi:hypothetical protein